MQSMGQSGCYPIRKRTWVPKLFVQWGHSTSYPKFPFSEKITLFFSVSLIFSYLRTQKIFRWIVSLVGAHGYGFAYLLCPKGTQSEISHFFTLWSSRPTKVFSINWDTTFPWIQRFTDALSPQSSHLVLIEDILQAVSEFGFIPF